VPLALRCGDASVSALVMSAIRGELVNARRDGMRILADRGYFLTQRDGAV